MAKTNKTEPQTPLIIGNTTFEITFTWDEVSAEYKKVLNRLAKQIKVAGFRKGTVPASVAEEQLDQQMVVERTLQKLLPERYTQEVTRLGKKPLTTPDFSLVSSGKNTNWVIQATIAEKPEFVMKEYKKVVKEAKKEAAAAIAKEKTEPKEQELDSINLQFIYGKLAEVFRPQVPELLVKREIEHDMSQMREQLQRLNVTLPEYIKRNNLTEQTFSQQVTVRALTRLQTIFVTDAVAKAEKIAIDDAAIDAHIDTLPDADFGKKERKNPDYRASLHQMLFTQAVHKHLLSL
ncbi:MAG: trigger factor [bacterium]|nr:trigger factor [bacterium]